MSVPADRAREQAQEILGERRFHETELPRPLERPLEWLGDRLRPIGEAIGDAVDALPGPPGVVWLVLAGLVLAASLAVALRLIRTRAPGARWPSGAAADGRPLDAAALEREAEEAERAGELERALRLRFRAGVLRLAERRLLDDPASVTTGRLVRRLRSDEFAHAARAFDEVVYGRRAPTVDDVRLAREGWRAVLAR
jgi:Domain of unknown function (DUF4129)